MTKIDIILETVEFYSADTSRRSITVRDEKHPKSTTCMYNSGDGRHCAVGRCMTEEFKIEVLELNKNTTDVNGISEGRKSLDEVLQKKYHGHNHGFWTNLQHLHDLELNWDSKGITARGLNEVKSLKQEYAIN
jgi:hypothetical protein